MQPLWKPKSQLGTILSNSTHFCAIPIKLNALHWTPPSIKWDYWTGTLRIFSFFLNHTIHYWTGTIFSFFLLHTIQYPSIAFQRRLDLNRELLWSVGARQKRREHIVKKEKKKAKTKAGAMIGKRALRSWADLDPWISVEVRDLQKKAAETCKNAKEGEHLPNCGDDTSCWRWQDGFMNLTNLHGYSFHHTQDFNLVKTLSCLVNWYKFSETCCWERMGKVQRPSSQIVASRTIGTMTLVKT